MRKTPVLGPIARQILYLYGCDIPASVEIGRDLHLPHRGVGTVLHAQVKIGDFVTIYHGVTVGRAAFGGSDTIIEDRVVLSVGCVVLSDDRADRTIGEGAVIAANAVVTCDVPPWEIWGGVPARKIGERDRSAPSPW